MDVDGFARGKVWPWTRTAASIVSRRRGRQQVGLAVGLAVRGRGWSWAVGSLYRRHQPRSRAAPTCGGGTHFEKKVEKAILALMAASTPSPAKDLPAPAVTVRTRRTSGQVNAGWRNV